MATAREIIGLAFREANYNAAEGDPTDTELSEGLTMLSAVQNSLFGMVVGTRMKPWFAPYPQRSSGFESNYPGGPGDQQRSDAQVKNPPENSRLIVQVADATTFFLPAMPADGALFAYVDVGHKGDVTLDANGALFGANGTNDQITLAGIFPERNAPRQWVFRSDLGAWMEIKTPALDDELAFPAAYDDYFITLMAIRLSPRYGNEPRQATMLRYRDMMGFIQGQWRQDEPTIGKDMGVPTEQAYDWDSFRGGAEGPGRGGGLW